MVLVLTGHIIQTEVSCMHLNIWESASLPPLLQYILLQGTSLLFWKGGGGRKGVIFRAWTGDVMYLVDQNGPTMNNKSDNNCQLFFNLKAA